MISLIRSLLAVCLVVVATGAQSAETKPFDAASFAALQAAGKPVLLDVYADWCPTCKQQAPIVSELMDAPEFRNYTVLKINFDSQKDVRCTFGVSQQSTFIVFKGAQEVARSTGDTNKDSIAATLRKAV